MAKALLFARKERSPCSQSVWRRPTDAAADPSLTDRGRSGIAPEHSSTNELRKTGSSLEQIIPNGAVSRLIQTRKNAQRWSSRCRRIGGILYRPTITSAPRCPFSALCDRPMLPSASFSNLVRAHPSQSASAALARKLSPLTRHDLFSPLRCSVVRHIARKNRAGGEFLNPRFCNAA
jgi:hypothetical protein